MRIHPAAKAIPEMLPDEYAALKADIQANGLLSPVETYNGSLLDGRHRFRACEELGIEPDVMEVDLDGMSPAQYVWSANGVRRHLTASQRACVAVELLPELTKAAKERQRQSKGRGKKGVAKMPDLLENPGRARDDVAALVGVSPRYVSEAQKLKTESPDSFQEVKAGTRKMPDAIRDMKRQTIRAKLDSVQATETKAVNGVYDVLVIDPPWPMQKIERDVRPNQSEFDYPIMTEGAIEEIDIPAADDCHVWLWTTHRFLPMAFRLLGAWRLKYVCTFVWHKAGGFQPIGLPQYNCEFALYARKGSPEFLDTKAFPTCFQAKRGKHSEKPEEFYNTIRRVTAGRRLDMFNRRHIDGFDSWGKEAAT